MLRRRVLARRVNWRRSRVSWLSHELARRWILPFWVNLAGRRISASVIVVLNNSDSLNHCLRVMARVSVILTTVFVVAVADRAENNKEQSDYEFDTLTTMIDKGKFQNLPKKLF